MTDRVSTITNTEAGRAFPRLARFLAENTTLPPHVAEQALRAAAGDYIGAKDVPDMSAMWKRAVDNANASIGVPADQAPAAAEKPSHRWANAVQNANARIGAG